MTDNPLPPSGRDAGLVQRILAGEREAYRELVLAHQLMLLSYAAHHLGDRALVDEVVQETFITAYGQLDRFRPDGDFAAWLRTLCRYAILTALKREVRERRHRDRFRQEIDRLLATARLDALDETAPAEPLQALRACLGELPEPAAELVRRRYGAGESAVSIAAQQGRTATAVTTALHRLRQALRRCIEQRLGAA